MARCGNPRGIRPLGAFSWFVLCRVAKNEHKKANRAARSWVRVWLCNKQKNMVFCAAGRAQKIPPKKPSTKNGSLGGWFFLLIIFLYQRVDLVKRLLGFGIASAAILDQHLKKVGVDLIIRM